MEYRKMGTAYIVHLQKGEEILQTLRQLCAQEQIALGTVQGIGAVGEATLGVFNRQKFAYESVDYQGDLEIVSCSGTVTQMDGQPYLHLHMAVGNPVEGRFHGGHLNRAVISLTGEFVVQTLPGEVGRAYSPEIGLNLFRFSDPA